MMFGKNMIHDIEYISVKEEADVVEDEADADEVIRVELEASASECASGISVDCMDAFFIIGKLHVVYPSNSPIEIII